jgi:hypothetical protein
MNTSSYDSIRKEADDRLRYEGFLQAAQAVVPTSSGSNPYNLSPMVPYSMSMAQYQGMGQNPYSMSMAQFPPGMGMGQNTYGMGVGQAQTWKNAPEVVTHDQYNANAGVLAAVVKQLQKQVDSQEEHLVTNHGFQPKKRTFDASNLNKALQIQSSSGKQITDSPEAGIDDDELDAKIDEIMKDEPDMDARIARKLAVAMLSQPKPKVKKARAVKAGVDFDVELWGEINLKHGQGETCPELLARVAAIDPNMMKAGGDLKSGAVKMIAYNRRHWGYVEMMKDPLTPFDQASLDEFVKLKKDHGFPEALDWDGKLPKP